MKFFAEYINMVKNYANFKDRTTVRGYWMAFLVNVIISAILSIIGIEWLAGLYSLALLVPGLGICVRRLRDAGYRWTWIFISLIPLVGWILLILKLVKPSVPDDGIPVV